jgi:hypothetical protein
MTPAEKRQRARDLEIEAKRLLKEAHDERPLPDFWRVGQKVRYLRNSEWAWTAGEIGYVESLRPEYTGRPAAQYQVFYTTSPDLRGRFWTTPDDVELVEDSP